MKYNLSYLFILSILFFVSCDKEPEGTNQLTKDQLRHLVGIDQAYVYTTPDNFNSTFNYSENSAAPTAIDINSQTNEEEDDKYRPQDRVNVIGTSNMSLTGKSILENANVEMKGSSGVPRARFEITTSDPNIYFYCDLNGIYDQLYSKYMTLESKTVNYVSYDDVYVFNATKAASLGFDFNGFKEIWFAKDYGYIKIELDPAIEGVPSEFDLEIVTTFEIPGIEDPITSTGVVAYYYEGSSVDAPPLLTQQQLSELINKKTLSDEEILYDANLRTNINTLRSSFVGGELQWANYIYNDLRLDSATIIKYNLSYDEVSQQIFAITNSNEEQPPFVGDDSLTIGAIKWNEFYISHISELNEDIYATKTGEPFAIGDSLSIHGDFENLLGFELSSTIEKGTAELVTPKGVIYGDISSLVTTLLIDSLHNPQLGGNYEDRVFLLDPRYSTIGTHSNPQDGVAVLRVQ